LIDGLLKLSRVGRAPLSRRRVDLSQLARAVAAQLLVGAGARQVQFDIAPGLQTAADERLLRIALENLLGNAWKFTCRRADALIEVGTDGSAGTFFVRDNGAGFDPAYTDRLFGVFQRLHSEKELAGTGAGLAIVQRIIQRHGGRVWAIGAVDRGATFYFSIPNDETL
jgi:light-regulated signal transduction histidine kinase (bacteriophytochrome)